VGAQGMAAEGASAIVDSLSTTPTCPICFDQARAVCVLPECFHSLCRACLQRASAGSASFKCPLCRTRVLTWTVTVFRTALATEEETSVIPPGLRIPSVVWRTLPSKLQRLLSLVNTILSADDNECGTEAVGGGDGCGDKQAASASPRGARILIYTQWLAHVEFIGQLLGSAHIESLRMSGDLGRCMQALQQFGTPGAPRVLVLSSQHHASGINLQVARHVILLHPYCTPSATYPEAVSFSSLKAFEQQAVGRVRRYPQTKPVVVYRLYAADTVEEVLYRGGYAEMGAPAASPETREA
jgi:SNF2 family DNA or RNA helicase